MPRHLFIVARDVVGLYEVLKEQFTGEPDVEVILDRRRGERRSRVEPSGEERRRRDRRERAHVDEEIRLRSHAILTLPT